VHEAELPGVFGLACGRFGDAAACAIGFSTRLVEGGPQLLETTLQEDDALSVGRRHFSLRRSASRRAR
jgi:hypothetical protein